MRDPKSSVLDVYKMKKTEPEPVLPQPKSYQLQGVYKNAENPLDCYKQFSVISSSPDFAHIKTNYNRIEFRILTAIEL